MPIAIGIYCNKSNLSEEDKARLKQFDNLPTTIKKEKYKHSFVDISVLTKYESFRLSELIGDEYEYSYGSGTYLICACRVIQENLSNDQKEIVIQLAGGGSVFTPEMFIEPTTKICSYSGCYQEVDEENKCGYCLKIFCQEHMHYQTFTETSKYERYCSDKCYHPDCQAELSDDSDLGKIHKCIFTRDDGLDCRIPICIEHYADHIDKYHNKDQLDIIGFIKKFLKLRKVKEKLMLEESDYYMIDGIEEIQLAEKEFENLFNYCFENNFSFNKINPTKISSMYSYCKTDFIDYVEEAFLLDF